MPYTPAPINTSDITLSESLLWIAEQLAENNHNVWASHRLAEGWTYGTERNDQARQTPCLVPYSQLDEVEKNYDRNTSMETLKVILKLGYRIMDPETAAPAREEKDTAPADRDQQLAPGQAVMVFSGHMIDQPSRTEPRFPPELEDSVRSRIRHEIRKNNGRVGYAAAAAGSDLLFLEEMLAAGGEIHIVLPVSIEDFREQSVQTGGGLWLDRFDRIITRAASMTILDQYSKATFNNTLQFCNIYMFGLARLQAEQAGANLCPLAVFDGIYLEGQLGGTSSMVEVWRRQQLPFSCVQLGEQEKNGVPVTAAVATADRTVTIPGCDGVRHHLCMAMLMLDFAACNTINREETVCPLPHLLQEVAAIINREAFSEKILLQRSMGHGLLLILDNFSAAVELARQLLTITTGNRTDQQEQNSPAVPAIRLSLNAGSCYSYQNPLTDKREYYGSQLEQAATPLQTGSTGSIMASTAFAAVCRALGIEGVSFEEPELNESATNSFNRAYRVH